MTGATWLVIGGGDKGGIVVRQGQDTASPLANERLSTGATVRQLALEGERLNYELLTGSGPSTGWVSLRLQTGKELMINGDDVWEVVGGADKGGILVREGKDVSSQASSERLSTGALVRELEVEGDRLRYAMLSGTGPESGWVGVRLQTGKELLVKAFGSRESASALQTVLAPGPAPGTSGAPLDIRIVNEDKAFSYEGLPVWVPRAAAVARLRREGKSYLPPPEEPLARLALVKQPPPFKKLLQKKVKEQFRQNLPGDMYGLAFPHTMEQMKSGEFGAEFLTKAFQAAGTLPADNRVTKLVRCDELPIKGIDTAGGAAMKMFITVEYLKPDPDLHTELLAKYTYDPDRGLVGVTTIGQDDAPEVMAQSLIAHLFPFRTPKFYWGDVCRETTAYMIIMEAIPYGKRGGAAERKPYEILPSCGKYQDFLLPNPEEYYFSLFRAMGQLAAWDKLGRFDSILGDFPIFDEKGFLQTQHRDPMPKSTLAGTKKVVSDMVDKSIDFMTNWAKNLVDPEVRDPQKMQKMKEELVEMCPHFDDFTFYHRNNSAYTAATHANLQADNAYFWHDEHGDLDCGILDWGGFGRAPFCMRFLGCLSGMDARVMLAHEEGILRSFVDDYCRCGGPKLPLEEVILRYRLGYITFAYNSAPWLDRQVYKETPKEEFLNFSGITDDKFQERFYTRCGSLTVITAISYYILRGDFKATFDAWAAGAGRPYLTHFV